MKSFLSIATLLLLGLASSQRADAQRPPNIVFIMLDELAYYELSHMGNPC